MTDKVLNIDQVAEQVKDRLGITRRSSIYEWLQRGVLKGFKIGGNGKSKRPWRVKQTDLDAFLSGEQPVASKDREKRND